MFNDLQRQTGTQQVQTGTTTQYQCTGIWYNRTCGYVTVPVYTSVPVYGSYASWQGCVEARPYPYNVNDTPRVLDGPATLFVPMFAPDETDNARQLEPRRLRQLVARSDDQFQRRHATELHAQIFHRRAAGHRAAAPGPGPT